MITAKEARALLPEVDITTDLKVIEEKIKKAVINFKDQIVYSSYISEKHQAEIIHRLRSMGYFVNIHMGFISISW